jgi:molybdenum cofactor biosynthesis protein B
MTHHVPDVPRVRCLVLVVSDTRSLDDDESGVVIAERLTAAGHEVVERALLRDDLKAIRLRVLTAAENGFIDAVILTGGTGIARRDLTPEAVRPLLNRELPGFGETFRRLSFDAIGPHGLLSRAFAGVAGRTVVFGLPGSRRACETAMDQLVLPMLPHAVGLATQ